MPKERTTWKKEPPKFWTPPFRTGSIDPEQFRNDWTQQSEEIQVGHTTVHFYYRKTQKRGFQTMIDEVVRQLTIFSPNNLEHLAVFFGGSVLERLKIAHKKSLDGVAGAATAGIVDGVVHASLLFPFNEKELIKSNESRRIDNPNVIMIGTPPMSRIPMRTVIAHELAHVDDFSQSNWEMGNHMSQKLNLVRVSMYAESADVEAWAEAKSLWQVGTDEEMGEHRDILYRYAFMYDWTKIV